MHTIPDLSLKYSYHWYNHMQFLPVILSNMNPIYDMMPIHPEPLVYLQKITIRHTDIGHGYQYFPLLTWLSVRYDSLMFDMIQDLIDHQGIHGFIPIWILWNPSLCAPNKHLHQCQIHSSPVHIYYTNPMWLQWVSALVIRGCCIVNVWNRCLKLKDSIKL